MILKTMYRVNYQIVTNWIEGFDRAESYRCKDFRKDLVPADVFRIILADLTEKMTIAIKLELYKQNKLNHLVYVDPAATIYLMSNEGKTIERIR